LQAYAKGDVHTSIGMRFELFQASWKVFLNHPMLGVGDDFKPALAEMVKAGVEIKPSYQLNDTHNEVLYALMRGGVVGLGQLLLVYLAPMVYFIRTLRRSVSGGAPILRAFAAAGLLLVLMTIDFGLSVNVFTRHIGKAFYFVTVCFLIAFCEIERRRPKRSASGGSLASHA
jgi:O-antigen ligase